MATTKSNKIGRIRIKLAEMLNELFPEWHFEPEDLWSQTPIYATKQFDCCRWGANGAIKDKPHLGVSISSWNTMTECVKSGISYTDKDYLSAEICIKD